MQAWGGWYRRALGTEYNKRSPGSERFSHSSFPHPALGVQLSGGQDIEPRILTYLQRAAPLVHCLCARHPLLPVHQRAPFSQGQAIVPRFVVGMLFGLEFVCIYLGMFYTDAARAGILINTSPFIVALGAYLFLRERLGILKIIGLALAFAGVYLVFQGKPRTWSSSMLFGDILELGAAVFWGATTVYIKKYLAGRVHPIHTFLYQLVFSIPIIFLCSYLLEEKWILNVEYCAGSSTSLCIDRRGLCFLSDMVQAHPHLSRVPACRVHFPVPIFRCGLGGRYPGRAAHSRSHLRAAFCKCRHLSGELPERNRAMRVSQGRH